METVFALGWMGVETSMILETARTIGVLMMAGGVASLIIGLLVFWCAVMFQIGLGYK